MAAPDQVWTLEHDGRVHRVTASRTAAHVVRWYVDDELHAERKTWSDTVTVTAEHGDGTRMLVYYSGLGAPRRATLYAAGEEVGALARLGGVDLVPTPGSGAAAHDEKLREHPTRYAVLAAGGGVLKVVVPILLSLLAVRFVVDLPWPDVDLPDLPHLPSLPLPSIPLPDLPDWHLPGWLRWLLDKVKYVWPVVLAYVVARAEIRRRQQRDRPEEPRDEA